MDEYGGLTKYSKRPKRESEKTVKINGAARANFLSHSSSFKNQMSHTLFVNSQNISGVGNKGRAAAFCDYISREEEALSVYGNKDEAKAHFREVENKVLPKRSNSVIQRRLVVQLPREFLNNPDKNLERMSKMLDEKYFSRSGAFYVALHSGGKDFRNPHLHIIFSNRDADLENIREFHDKDFLLNVKKDIAQFISQSQEIGVKCEISKEKKRSRHYPRWVSEAYKKYKNNPEQLKKYCEKYEILANYSAEMELREQGNELSYDTKKFNEKLKKFNESLEANQFINQNKNNLRR